MKNFIADLHVHSRFSRATSKNLTPRNLAAWASVKGIQLLATGDFTHPGWLEMISDQLKSVENGFFRLKDQSGLGQELPWFSGTGGAEDIRFVLCTEISSIYKKGGKVRKIHNLVFMPGLEAVRKFNIRLGQVGNLASDGRPILGLPARDLLEMVLETDPLAFLVPAHIWTPWFSLFGSKSGFNRLEDCFEDLSSEIFALETGLSSDPEMNQLWSALDRYTLISNSDAHSGEKLGREANLLSGEMSFPALRAALRKDTGPARFEGTLEFYPEEGKYHLDGHRKCGIVLEPAETARLKGICPVCGKELTIGVLNRVFELADRETPVRSAAQKFSSLVPLTEILSEILGSGSGTKKVMGMYNQLLRDFGSELDILRRAPVEDLKKSSALLAEAVDRMRKGQVRRHSGYDGEYGRISMFTPRELLEFRHGRTFSLGGEAEKNEEIGQKWRKPVSTVQDRDLAEDFSPNEMQVSAMVAGPGPVLVLAGPGTGKTQTLMGRIRRLEERGADFGRMLVVTFTRKAARELKERLEKTCRKPLPRTDTLHALALEYWTEVLGESPTLLSEESSRKIFAAANPGLQGKTLKTAWNELSLARESGRCIPNEYARRYLDRKTRFHLVDYTDLLEFWMEKVKSGSYGQRFDHVLVDEVQDLSLLQLNLVMGLAGERGTGFFAIGDPNQSIYGFRGAVRGLEERIRQSWPDLKRIRLSRNYRSAQDILDLSSALLPERQTLVASKNLTASISLFEAKSAEQEADWIAARIRDLLGGTGHWQADRNAQETIGPGDIAVLVRLKALTAPIARKLHATGIPVSVPEDEPFFADSRVALLLSMAGRMLGLPDAASDAPECPEEIIKKGPLALAAHLSETPPFDGLFWKNSAFLGLVKAFQTYGGWQGVMNMTQLETELCAIRARAQKVQIMTLHGSKGLEFDTVFLPCLEEGIVPFAGMDMLLGKPASEILPDMDEERRLFYVGLTRAKTGIFMSYCSSRKFYGKIRTSFLSSFVRGLPQDMIRKSALKRHVRRDERQLSLF